MIWLPEYMILGDILMILSHFLMIFQDFMDFKSFLMFDMCLYECYGMFRIRL